MSSGVTKNISFPENLSGRFQPAAVMRRVQGYLKEKQEAESPGKSSWVL